MMYWKRIWMAVMLLVSTELHSVLSDEFKPSSMVLAHEDKVSFPWIIPLDGGGYKGLDLVFMNLLRDELGIPLEIRTFPWARCIATMGTGDIDGVFASSYKKDRLKMGIYPVNADGTPDTRKRIHMSGYSLYYLAGKNVTFDGTTVTGLNGMVGVQRTFSIMPQIEKLGLKVDDGTADPVAILKKVLVGRNEAAAFQILNGDTLIADNPEFEGKIIRLNTNLVPFNQKPYFIMLSHQFAEKYPAFTKQFYDAAERVRESDEYRKACQNFFQERE
ncbi:MAG: transporter substrate-binding domain-containing protein [Spartobacteria bacterium]|nr:transporter substrate-binding domain-containing protein [Spartobacteria bacterium]